MAETDLSIVERSIELLESGQQPTVLRRYLLRANGKAPEACSDELLARLEAVAGGRLVSDGSLAVRSNSRVSTSNHEDTFFQDVRWYKQLVVVARMWQAEEHEHFDRQEFFHVHKLNPLPGGKTVGQWISATKTAATSGRLDSRMAEQMRALFGDDWRVRSPHTVKQRRTLREVETMIAQKTAAGTPLDDILTEAAWQHMLPSVGTLRERQEMRWALDQLHPEWRDKTGVKGAAQDPRVDELLSLHPLIAERHPFYRSTTTTSVWYLLFRTLGEEESVEDARYRSLVAQTLRLAGSRSLDTHDAAKLIYGLPSWALPLTMSPDALDFFTMALAFKINVETEADVLALSRKDRAAFHKLYVWMTSYGNNLSFRDRENEYLTSSVRGCLSIFTGHFADYASSSETEGMADEEISERWTAMMIRMAEELRSTRKETHA